MSIILALDPGPVETGLAVYDSDHKRVLRASVTETPAALNEVIAAASNGVQFLAIEMISGYGKGVGESVFATCLWVGRLMQAWQGSTPVELVYRTDVKMLLCGNRSAGDAAVRQALLAQFAATGGGAVPQVGTKSQPGPLYGVASHSMAALAVALACAQGMGRVMRGTELTPLHPDVHAAIFPTKK